MSDLYDEDIVLWSERQGELLRRRAAGELINDAELDSPNIAEEIKSVGNEQRFAVESLLVQAIVHLLKAHAWPEDAGTHPTGAQIRCDSAVMRRRASSRRCDNGSTLREYGAGRCGPCPIRLTAWHCGPCRRPVLLRSMTS